MGEENEEQDMLLLKRTHIFKLVETGNVEYMKTLLEAGAILEIKGDDGSTLLHCAARAEQTNMVKYLIDQGANVNHRTSVGRTALHEAVESGNQEIVELLLEHRADFKPRDYRTWKTAAHYAVIAGRVDITQSLLESYRSERTTVVADLLLSASEAGQPSVIELLLSYPGVLLNRGMIVKALRKACMRGHTPVVSQLLELNNINVNAKLLYRCLLHWAGVRGHIDIVSLLLGHKDIHIDDDIVLRMMKRWFRYKPPKKSLDILRLLLQHPNSNVNPADCSITRLLHKAVGRGLADGVRLLFDCKDLNIDVNARNDRSETALQIARQRFEEMAALKKRHESERYRVIWYASRQQDYEKTISILLAQGAMEDISDRNISTSIFDEPTTMCSDGNETTMEFSGLSDLDEEVDMYYYEGANDITAIQGTSRLWDL
jgi:ankyrin repeat protein